jgi:hypothetical protein
MYKRIVFFLFILFSANSFATLLKATATGSVTANELSSSISDPNNFCCTDELIDINFAFTTIINLDNFQVLDFGFGQEFLFTDFNSNLTLNNVEAPSGLVQPDPFALGNQFTHIISPESSGGTVSSIQLNAGLTFNQQNRFLITDNLFLRELTLFANIFNVNSTIGDPDNLQRFLNALTEGTLPLDTFAILALGDNNDPADNFAVSSFFTNVQLDFEFVPQQVPEPTAAFLLGLGALFVAIRRKRV